MKALIEIPEVVCNNCGSLSLFGPQEVPEEPTNDALLCASCGFKTDYKLAHNNYLREGQKNVKAIADQEVRTNEIKKQLTVQAIQEAHGSAAGLYPETTRDQLFALHVRCASAAFGIMVNKNQDYGTAEDALRNFRRGGLRGICTRLGDKDTRMLTWAEKEAYAVEESFIETGLDAINYVVLAIAWYLEHGGTFGSGLLYPPNGSAGYPGELPQPAQASPTPASIVDQLPLTSLAETLRLIATRLDKEVKFPSRVELIPV